MDNPNNELASRTGALFSWLEFLGLAALILSRTAFKTQEWLLYAGAALILSGFIYKLVRDWRAGNHKSVRMRVLILLLAIVLGGLVGWFKYRNP